ncbi:hypothetical protein HK107_05695 [Parvularcula sp. ZS-1/3]|uniref:Uncharacterized protein n=1 Tax=Parvularcula mediterranea TaxID=2732508 RepID=A0A7Y3RKM0_9PROT|nr:hypothetical protein [Parvularcula mediterranea]NNU15812.1 hypothetical protein [Parvularcula mediterranea]
MGLLRPSLLGFGWASFVGSVADALILSHHLILSVSGESAMMASVRDHILDHLPFLAWLIPLAQWILPEGWADWLFALPAVGYFPVRILFSIVTGTLALRWAARIKAARS